MTIPETRRLAELNRDVLTCLRNLSTRHRGDGSEPEFVVYENREIIARFPMNDPARPDARLHAEEFIAAPGLRLLLRRALTQLAAQERLIEPENWPNDDPTLGAEIRSALEPKP